MCSDKPHSTVILRSVLNRYGQICKMIHVQCTVYIIYNSFTEIQTVY